MNEEDIKKRTTRLGLNFLALCALVLALRYGRIMMIPVVVSLMLTTVLWPAVQYLTNYWRLPRPLSGLIVIAGLVFSLLLILLWGAVAIQSIWRTLPSPDSWLAKPPPRGPAIMEARQLGFALADGFAPLTASTPAASSFAVTLAATPRPAIPLYMLDDRSAAIAGDRSPYQIIHDRVAREISRELADDLFPGDPEKSFLYRNLQPVLDEQYRNLPTYIGRGVEQIVFILFLVLFLLVEGEMLMRRTAEIFGPSTGPYSRAARQALADMATQVRAYLVWRTIINMAMTLVLGLIYQYGLGMTFPWVWAILAGVLTYVPYIGPIIAFVPTAADALFSPAGGVWALAAVTLIYIAILTLEGYVVFPLVIGRNMEMNATTVLLACLFWWLVWGEIGLFLAMPLIGGIKAICQNVPGWEPWANLMGMETDEPGTGRRRRLRRAVRWLLLGPLAPLGAWMGMKPTQAAASPTPQPSETTFGDNGEPQVPEHEQPTEPIPRIDSQQR